MNKKELDFNKQTFFLPVKPLNNDAYENNSYDLCITTGKYDANYVINLCKQIIQKCEDSKFERNDNLNFSLKHSLKILISKIEGEMLGNPKMPKTFKCDDCDQIYFTLPDKINVKCPHCKNRKQIPNLQ